jgi:cytochrome c
MQFCKSPFSFSWLLLCLCIALLACNKEVPQGEATILVFSKTSGFRHESIPAGIAAIQKLGVENNFKVDTTENAEKFTEDNLKQYSAVVFLNTTQDVLNHVQQREFERFIQAGGGFVGVHAAADTEYSWPWYNKLVGAYFNGHPNNPNVRKASIDVTDRKHISSRHLPARWERTDEWYNYKSINPEMKIIANLDEKTYEGGTNGEQHPIAWYHEYDGGRAFYTGGGHTNESYTEPFFVQHLLGGITYALGERRKPDYSRATSLKVPEDNRFSKVVLDEKLNEPMELTVAADGRVFFVERTGKVKLYDPSTDKVSVAGQLNVFSKNNDGLLGITLDPGFATNSWLYLYYSPAGDTPKQHLSRFTLKEGKVDLSSEKILLEIPTQRQECCHSAGSLTFDKKGNLYLSTGDNTGVNATAYAPIDERPSRSAFDAQKSSANTNDLRGKILRIKPQPDGTYTILKAIFFQPVQPVPAPKYM